MKRDTTKSKILGGIVLVVGLTGWILLLIKTSVPEQVHMPVRTLSPVTVSPVPKVLPTHVSSPSPKLTPHKPPSQSRVIYVVAKNVPNVWGLQEVTKAWSVAKYEDFKIIDQCPVAEPCVSIYMDLGINKALDAETDFGYNNDIAIRLNSAVKTRLEAQSSMCHELGHVLGLPHVIGTTNSCMPAIGDYIMLPSKLDLQLVDRMGHWNLEKAYRSSLKDIDVRKLPS